MAAPSYCFVARDAQSGSWVELDIRPSCENATKYFAKVWHKLALAVHNSCELCQTASPNWTTWQPHDWSKKVIPDRVKWVAWDGDFLAGFLNLRNGRKSDVDGSAILYIEHVAAFPGNQSTCLWDRRLTDIGPALLAFASYQGMSDDAGRLGLHADNEAVGWYDHLDKQFGGIFEVRRTGVAGLYPGAEKQVYFETSVAGARQLLEEYRDG